MSNKTLFKMKKELSEHGIKVSDTASLAEVTKLFYELPITHGQIQELKLLNINYNPKFGWSRGKARDFINSSRDYYRLRGYLPASPKQRILLLELDIEVPEGTTSAEAALMIANSPATVEQLFYIEKNKVRTQTGKKLTYGYCEKLIASRERRIFEYKMAKKKES